MSVNTIEDFVRIDHQCPMCGSGLQYKSSESRRKCRNMKLTWVCTACDDVKHRMTLKFNRLLERDENFLIQVKIRELRCDYEQGEDISKRKVDLPKLGVFCRYTMQYTNLTTGEKSVQDIDARSIIDLDELVDFLQHKYQDHSLTSDIEVRGFMRTNLSTLKALNDTNQILCPNCSEPLMSKVLREVDGDAIDEILVCKNGCPVLVHRNPVETEQDRQSPEKRILTKDMLRTLLPSEELDDVLAEHSRQSHESDE